MANNEFKDDAPSSGSWFSIPGNIKQGFLPFVLDPTKPINQVRDDFDKVSPQLFTYKENDTSPGGTAQLGIYPMTAFPNAGINVSKNNIAPIDLNNDISYKLLYQRHDDPGVTIQQPLTIANIFSNLPSVSIREFLPDTRLDQCLNFFKDIFGEMSKLYVKAVDVAGKEYSSQDIKQRSMMKSIWNCAWFTIQYMTGMGDVNFAKDFINYAEKSAKNARETDAIALTGDEKLRNYVHDFPYILYYRLQSCTTTNIYRIPAMCEGKPIMSSDGMPGWGDGSDLMGAGGFRVSGMLNKIPMIGQLAEMLLGNIGINYMPWWNAESGAKTAAPEINIKFDLFNDNVIRAVQNFIFINTIVPNNKWIQYNMFQHSSNLYDVKIDGVDRLFACSGKFEVTYEGVLRNPPQEFLTQLKSHINTSMYKDSDDFIQSIIANNLIKIPDIYRVNMTFKSLLPANFNNFLYTYSKNVNHMTAYQINVRDNTLGDVVGKTIYKFARLVKFAHDIGAKNAMVLAGMDDNDIKDRKTNNPNEQTALNALDALIKAENSPAQSANQQPANQQSANQQPAQSNEKK